MKPYLNAFKVIVFLLLLVSLLGVGYYFGIKQKGPQAAYIPTSEAGQALATRIAQLTITPGTGSEQTMATTIPWSDVYKLGDAPLLESSLQQVFASAGMDLRVSTVTEQAALGMYCIQGHLGSNDTLTPLADQARNGSVILVPGTRYCVGVAKLGELWGGVLQSDLQKFELVEIPHNVVNTDTKVITHTETVDIIIEARFGLLTHSVQPGNEIKKTFDDPNGVIRELIDFSKLIKIWFGMGEQGDEEFWRNHIDEADNFASELATLELIAPMGADGVRSTSNLDRLRQQIALHFNSPSPNPQEPWPYDHLYALALQKAQQAGYEGVGTFEVKLIWPDQEGVYYYLMGLDTAPQPVINPADGIKFRDNLYPYYKDEISTDWASLP